MSLTTAFSIAQNALFNTSRQTNTVSRNIAEAQNPDYTRRTAVLASTVPGSRVIQIQRAQNELLFKQNMSALSSWSGQDALSTGIDRLGITVNGVDNATSAATLIGNLQQAMQTYASSPSNRNLAESAIEAARQVVRGLNDGTAAIQSFRSQTDSQIAGSVNDLNNLLASFHDLNQAIVGGTQLGKDVNDELDRRDAVLKKIAEIVPVTTLDRGANDMVLITGDGATLYETVPRKVTFTPNNTYVAGMPGNTVYIDGVPLVSGSGGNTSAGGKLAALTQLRDTVSTSMQSQLDEVARGLISSFAETDPSGLGVLPDAPGLFTWTGAPATPGASMVPGLAGLISINPAMDSNVGGNPELLRDGGANGLGYVANATGAASYSDLLRGYNDRLAQPFAFDAAAGLGTGKTLNDFSAGAVGWLDGLRKEAATASEGKLALVTRTSEALSNVTGVNVDEEMALLLDLENSYQASARLIKAVDDMLMNLFAAVG